MTEQPNPSVLVVNPARETGAAKSAHEALRAAGIEVLITLGRRGQLLGAVLLGPRRSGDAFFANDLVFIESLAELASIALENALKLKWGKRPLNQAEKFDWDKIAVKYEKLFLDLVK